MHIAFLPTSIPASSNHHKTIPFVVHRCNHPINLPELTTFALWASHLGLLERLEDTSTMADSLSRHDDERDERILLVLFVALFVGSLIK
jgi:hypothetical protein